MTSTTTPSETTLVSVVLSFRNEEEVIPELIDRLQKMFRTVPVRYEIIFVNDDSSDRSLALLMQRHTDDPNIKVLNMSRRFGVAECALAGMEHARGGAVILMDADLQDPPEVIPQLIEKWQQGADVVYTVRASRAGEPAYKLLLTKLAYRLIHAVSEIELPDDAGDFKLLSRRVTNELLKLRNEKDPYLRGLVTWLGFKQVPVFYHRQPRFAGETHFPIFRSKNPLKTLLSGMMSFSLFPLQVFMLIAAFVCLGGVICLGVLVVQLCWHVNIPQWWPVVVILICLAGIQMLGIGFVGLYLGRIHNQTRGRPNYIVSSTAGFNAQQE